jgi:ABC-type lipoprotein export system ATPase subunit
VIEKIEIRNYRSCFDTSFELQPDLSVLIGPNGSGKTNLLNACVLLRKLTSEQVHAHREDEQPTDESRLKVSFRVKKKRATLTADLGLFTDEHNEDVIVRAKESWYVKDFTDSAKRIKAPLSLARYFIRDGMMYSPRSRRLMLRWGREFESPPESFRGAFSTIARYLAEIKYYSASQFTNPSRCPVSFQVETEGPVSHGPRRGGHSKFLFDLFTEYKGRENSNYDQFLGVIGPNGIGLVDKIDFKEIPTSSIEYSVRSGGKVGKQKRKKMLVIPQFTVGRNNLSPSQLSEGTFKTITLLFYLMTETSSALLIEEPEVCVHHGLLSSIVELIKTYSRQKQIVLSTHSDFVLDQIEPRHVYRVARDNRTGTTVTHVTDSLSSDELTALRHYLDSEGNLGEYWRHGGLE